MQSQTEREIQRDREGETAREREGQVGEGAETTNELTPGQSERERDLST